jgi:peptide/nickel transport system ATP-binding protein
MPLLKTENLVVEKSMPGSPRDLPILQNLSIAINENQITGIIGESGAGKTILGKTLAALLPGPIAVTGGTIYYDNRPVTFDLLKKMRGRHIFYTPQNAAASLNPVLKIKNQVNETSKIEKPAMLEIFKDLEFPEPERILNAYPFELSGGENQRCLLATALARHPRLLILDEPTASLDAHLQEGFMRLIKEIQHRYRLTILLITHNLRVARNITDYIYIILKGKIVEEGQPWELFSCPVHPYSREIVKAFSEPAASGGSEPF